LYSQFPSFVLGFHGCDASVAESVFQGKTLLQSSRNDYDWLGEGIYFWEHSPARALEYATHLQTQRRRAGPRIKKPAVVGALIDLGHCLNLLDSKFLKLVANGYHGLSIFSQASGIGIPANRATGTQSSLLLRDLDCAVINYVHQSRLHEGLQSFDTVRSVFVEGDPLYPTAGFHSKNHIQLCVRNPESIKGYFRPLADPPV
jgi:hypothetical protein